jgi:AbrB family looped-hinge helix DNA binding protein
MDNNLQTLITKRGQTVVPAQIRKKYGIKVGDRLVWLDNGETIKVIPVPADAIRALRGRGKGEKLVEALLQARREERERER